MKKALTLLTIILAIIPLPVAAISRPVFSTINSAAQNSGTRWSAYDAGLNGFNTNTTNARRTPISIPGTISNLYVRMGGSPGAGTQYEIVLYKNGVATSLSCVIADTDTSCTDLVDTVTVAEGDDVDWAVTPTNTPTNGLATFISSKFESTNPGETAISGSISGASNCLLNPYFSPQGSIATSTESSARSVAPTAFTLDKFYVRLESGPGAGDSFTYTVYKNGSPTSLTTTISDTNVDNSDTTNSVSFAAGDYISVECVGAGSPSAPRHQWGFRVTPDIDGETPIFMGGAGSLSLVTRYPAIVGGITNASSASSTEIASPMDFDIKKAYARFSTAQTAGRDWNFTIKKNFVDGALSPTILATNTEGNDTTNTESFTAGDFITWESNPPNPGTNPIYVSLSAVLYVAPTQAPQSLPYRIYNLGQMLLNNGSFIIQ